MDQAALAALLHDGLITIDADGLMAPSGESEPEPAHSVPAAWLECLHRAERPTTMSELRDDPELRQRHEAFLKEQDALLADWNKPDLTGHGCAVFGASLVVGLLDAVLLVLSIPDSFYGPTAFERIFGLVTLMAVAAPVLTFTLIGAVLATYPAQPSPLYAYCAQLPPHPAVTALTAEEERLLAGASGVS
ncbi:hypothetical protein ACFPIJ_53165 [Dactylosporangium cerinum]|uniref:Integral membrane protein n=1 Tax=Dactylosporangium cerinum TaxID=1434730 RepID=A0ABV9WFL2_9ACTN